MALQNDIFDLVAQIESLADAPLDDRSKLKSLKFLERDLAKKVEQLQSAKGTLKEKRQDVKSYKEQKLDLAREIAAEQNPGVDVITPEMISQAKQDPRYRDLVQNLRKAKKQRKQARETRDIFASEEESLRQKTLTEEQRISELSPKERAIEQTIDLLIGKGLGKKTRNSMMALGFRELDIKRQQEEQQLMDTLAGSGRLRGGLLTEGLQKTQESFGQGQVDVIEQIRQLNRETRLANRELGMDILKNFTKSELQQHFAKNRLAAEKVAQANLLGSSQAALESQLYFDRKGSFLREQAALSNPNLTTQQKNSGFGSGFLGGFIPGLVQSGLDIYKTKTERKTD